MIELPGEPFDITESPPRWWVKIVGMLQQNWALPIADDGRSVVIFVDDAGGMFDRLEFANDAEMTAAMIRNGFEDYANSPRLQQFLHPPQGPLRRREHSNGAIYSSGRFWQG